MRCIKFHGSFSKFVLARSQKLPPLIPSLKSLWLSCQVDNIKHSTVLIVLTKSVVAVRFIISKHDMLRVRLWFGDRTGSLLTLSWSFFCWLDGNVSWNRLVFTRSSNSIVAEDNLIWLSDVSFIDVSLLKRSAVFEEFLRLGRNWVFSGCRTLIYNSLDEWSVIWYRIVAFSMLIWLSLGPTGTRLNILEPPIVITQLCLTFGRLDRYLNAISCLTVEFHLKSNVLRGFGVHLIL